MNEAFTQILAFIGSYLAVIFLLLFVLNWATKGFLLTYLRVKASKGKYTLAVIHSVTDVYYKAGKWEDKCYKVKTRSKTGLSIPIDGTDFKPLVKNLLGVPAVEIDETGKVIFDKDNTPHKVVNIDPGRLDSLIIAVKNRPRAVSKKEQLKFIALILLLVGMIAIYTKLGDISEAIATLKQLSVNI